MQSFKFYQSLGSDRDRWVLMILQSLFRATACCGGADPLGHVVISGPPKIVFLFWLQKQ